ncbi:MAG: hemerythrin domain-containing protein [Pseudomonadota bacterium]|nr:hemerythrin domain-containing protein [Pseudomonadota bacterium]
MFFSSQTVNALVRDHDELREDIRNLKDTELSMRERRNSFARLIPNLVSHTKREESAVYSYMKSADAEDLKPMALEGEEEHRLVDQLVKEMKSEKISPEDWSAKGKVLAELIEHHVDEEETEVFPKLKKQLDDSTDADLCEKYENPMGNRNANGRKTRSSVPRTTALHS